MIEFIVGLFFGYVISGADLGEPVPSEIITYSDSGRVVKIYRSDFHGHRYYPNSIAIGWNTHDYSYWETRPDVTPIYSKSVVIKRKPKKSGEYRRKKDSKKGKKK